MRKEGLHLTKRKSDPRWWYAWWYGNDGKQKQQRLEYLRAEFSREEMLDIIKEGSGNKEPCMYSIDWLERTTLKEPEIRPNTVNIYKNAFKHHKNFRGKGFFINDIDREYVLGFRAYLKDKKLAGSTINLYVHVIAGAMKKVAFNKDKIDYNPFRRYYEPVTEVRNNGIEFPRLTKEGVAKFLKVISTAKNEDLIRLTRILVYTGMRRGEVLSILRDDVDLHNEKPTFGIINIKSRRRSKRYLPIPEIIWGNFKYFMDKYRFSLMPFKQTSPGNLSRWIKGQLVKAGFPELHAHSLRHTFVTRTIEEGEDLRLISRYVGHSEIKTTEGYAHDVYEKAPEIGVSIY